MPNSWLMDRCDKMEGKWKDAEAKVKELEAENKKLKELTDGIMNEEGTGHILGCNAYEKFCQAMCELNYDEKWITELKEENEKLKAQNDYLWSPVDADDYIRLQKQYDELKEEIKELREQLNEESQQRLKNKECWMAVQKQYHELKKKYMKTITTAAKQKKELKTKLDDACEMLNNLDYTLDDNGTWCEKGECVEDEEVDTCAKCNKKRECHSDLFVTHDETMTGRTGDWGSGKKFMLCGECSLNHLLVKQVKC